MESPKLKVVFLVGHDSPSIRQKIEGVCLLAGIEPVGVLLDDQVVPFKQRQKNLVRNVLAKGWSYPFLRIVEAICTATTNAVNNAAVSPTAVAEVLKEAFPEACFSLSELGEKYGMIIHAVADLNNACAIRALDECGADIGIVLGTRALEASTFAVPRMGCITLSNGKYPEHREAPHGFWELYEGAATAEVSVRFIDHDQSTGNIVASSAISIQKTETPESLLQKLNEEGGRLLAAAVGLIRDGQATRQPQGVLEASPRSEPTRDGVLLRRRLPHWKTNGTVLTIVRNLYVLIVYYSGIYFTIRQWHRLSGSRGAIVLYHRVNDYSKDVLTVDCETFAAQLLAISQRYPISTTAGLVDRILAKKPLQPTTVAIHFDDCYRDIFTNGAPIMKALGVPACAFINSGFVDTSRTFNHDVGYPFTYEMLRSSDVQTWSSMGFEVGAHTVNHVDLGTCATEAARHEILQCGLDLEKIIGKPIDLFSFPFGRPENIRDATMQIIQTSGYIANFCANGGFIGTGTDPYYIPRGGAHYESSPVYCLLQIEGLTLSRIAKKIRKVWNGSTQLATRA